MTMAALKCTRTTAAVMGTVTLLTIGLVLMANSIQVEPKSPHTSDQIQVKSFLVDEPITLECPLLSDIEQNDGVNTVVWYKGFNQKVSTAQDKRGSTSSLIPLKNPAIKTTNYPQYPIKFSDIFDGEMFQLASAQRRGNDSKNLQLNRTSFEISFTNAFVDNDGNPLRIQASVEHPSGMAKLVIMDAKLADEGLYRCRVHFVSNRTKTYNFQVEMIVPPKNLTIQDTNGSNEILPNGKLKTPYDEGTENVTLTCETEFVKPKPSVLWYEGSRLMDGNLKIYERIEMSHSQHRLNLNISVGSKVAHRKGPQANITKSNSVLVQADRKFFQARNLLVIRKLSRDDVGRTFRCVAYNVNWIPPFEVNVTLDVYLRPLNVTIEIGSGTLVAGSDVSLVCYSHGSRPAAQFAWFKNGELISDWAEGYLDPTKNISRSHISWTATPSDHDAEVVCQARNPMIKSDIGVMNDSVKLDVKFPPEVSLTLRDAQYLNKESYLLVKSTTIHLDCNVRANPPASSFPNKTIIWRYNGTKMYNDFQSGINIVSNGRTLKLSGLLHSIHDGSYSCFFENEYGSAESNTINVSVSFAPFCDPKHEPNYYVAVNQSVDFLCNVRASPPITHIHWKVDNSIGVGNYDHVTRGNASTYFPLNLNGFGKVYCFAGNEVGEMYQPCVFKVIPYGLPDSVQSCKVLQTPSGKLRRQTKLNQTVESEANQTYTLEIYCQFKYNGGSQANCHVEMYRVNDSVLAWSGRNEPEEKYMSQNNDCIIRPTSLVVRRPEEFRIVVLTFNGLGNATKAYEFNATILPIKNQTTLDVAVSKTEKETMMQYLRGYMEYILFVFIAAMFGTAAFAFIRMCKRIFTERRKYTEHFKSMKVPVPPRKYSVGGSLQANPGNLEQVTSFMNGPSEIRLDTEYWRSSYGITDPDMDIFLANQSEQDKQPEQFCGEVPPLRSMNRCHSLRHAGTRRANPRIYPSCSYESIYPPPPAPFNQQQTEENNLMLSNYGSFLNTSPEQTSYDQPSTSSNNKRVKYEEIEMRTYRVGNDNMNDPFADCGDFYVNVNEGDDGLGPNGF